MEKMDSYNDALPVFYEEQIMRKRFLNNQNKYSSSKLHSVPYENQRNSVPIHPKFSFSHSIQKTLPVDCVARVSHRDNQFQNGNSLYYLDDDQEISDINSACLVQNLSSFGRFLEIMQAFPLPKLSLTSACICVLLSIFVAPRPFVQCLIFPAFRLSFGTLYPAYASYKAVRTKNVKEYVKWMMYWIVYAFFTCIETFTDIFLVWFPFYYEIKVIIVLWLLSPATKGSSTLYRKFVHPMLTRREQEIDEYLNQAKERGYSAVLQLGSKSVNYATNVIMQTALKTLQIGTNPEREGELRALTHSQSDNEIFANRSGSQDSVDANLYMMTRSSSLNIVQVNSGEFSEDDYEMGLAEHPQSLADEEWTGDRKSSARVRAAPSRKAKLKKQPTTETDDGAKAGRSVRSRRKLRETTPYIDVE